MNNLEKLHSEMLDYLKYSLDSYLKKAMVYEIYYKRGLMKKLASDKTSLEFKTLYNWCGKNVGETREVVTVQTNAFTLLSSRNGREVESWIYPYEKDIEVKNNHIYYYGYFYDVYSAEKWLKVNNIPKEHSEIITLKDNDS
mgnify:CR=1 FL=1